MRRSYNKGWVIFGKIVVCILVACAIFAATIGIAALINKVGYIDQFKDWFIKDSSSSENVEAAGRTLFRTFKTMLKL